MWSGSWKGTGYLLVAMLPAACPAADSVQICSDWQAKFHQVQASWLAGATTRAELERIYGIPTRTEAQGACTQVNYAATGCSCWFTVCSQGTVVSKTLIVGAAAAPVFLSEDPAGLAEAVTTLHQKLRDLQAEVSRLQQILEDLAPPAAPGPVSPPPKPASVRPPPAPTAAPRCAAITKKGTQCTRRAEKGSAYCWQHKGGS
jgi:hypothetical protein